MNLVSRYFIRAREVEQESITTLEQASPKLDQLLSRLGYSGYDSALHQFYAPDSGAKQGITGIYFFDTQKSGDLVRRPGHLTIHTWPETESYALDLLQSEESSLVIENVRKLFPGDYRILRELNGEIGGAEIPQQFGRQALAYLVAPKDKTYLNLEKAVELLEEVSQKARFKIAVDAKTGKKRTLLRANNDYLSAAVVLTTSHFSLHYLPKEEVVITDIFTCTEQGIDEGDPNLGLNELILGVRPEEVKSRTFLTR